MTLFLRPYGNQGLVYVDSEHGPLKSRTCERLQCVVNNLNNNKSLSTDKLADQAPQSPPPPSHTPMTMEKSLDLVIVPCFAHQYSKRDVMDIIVYFKNSLIIHEQITQS